MPDLYQHIPNDGTERSLSGEPCRCPESVLDCECGHYVQAAWR